MNNEEEECLVDYDRDTEPKVPTQTKPVTASSVTEKLSAEEYKASKSCSESKSNSSSRVGSPTPSVSIRNGMDTQLELYECTNLTLHKRDTEEGVKAKFLHWLNIRRKNVERMTVPGAE